MIGAAWMGLILLIALLWLSVRALTGRPQIADLRGLGDTAALGPQSLQFCRDYVHRSIAFRRAGTIIAVVLGCVWSVRWSGQVALWTGTTATSGSIVGTILFTAVFGAIIGALLAECYHLRPGRGPRRASLEARPSRPLPRLTHASWLVTGAAIALAGADWARIGTPGLALGLLPGLVAVAMAEAIQLAVSGRRRPILDAQAMLVDRMLRRAVATSAVWLELAAAILCLGWTAMGAGIDLAGGTNSAPSWRGAAAFVLTYGGFFAVVPALVCVHRGALARIHRFPHREEVAA